MSMSSVHTYGCKESFCKKRLAFACHHRKASCAYAAKHAAAFLRSENGGCNTLIHHGLISVGIIQGVPVHIKNIYLRYFINHICDMHSIPSSHVCALASLTSTARQQTCISVQCSLPRRYAYLSSNCMQGKKRGLVFCMQGMTGHFGQVKLSQKMKCDGR